MYLPLVVIFCALAFCSAVPTEQTCPGGYRQGEKVEKGSAWFECRDGQLQVKGCVTPNGDRLKFDDTLDANSVRSVCRSDGSNAKLVPKACVQYNQEHAVGDRWDDSKYVYTCKKDGDVISLQISGCIRDGKKVDAGQTLTINGVVYECKMGGLTPFLAPWGCVADDGSQHKAGDTFDIAPYWYTCDSSNGIVSMTLSGCVNRGRRFKDGDHFYKDGVVFECQAKENGGNLKVVGCLQENPSSGIQLERRVGCTWNEGEAPYQVTMKCVPDQDAKTAVPTVVACNYRMAGGNIYNIDVGCYRLFDKVAVGCIKNESTGKVTAKPLEVNDKGEVQSVPRRLRFC